MPIKTTVPPKITASQRFLSRLNPATRAHLEKVIGEPITPTDAASPEAPSSSPPERNRRQERAIERAQNSAALARRRSPRSTTPKRDPRRQSQIHDARHLDRLRGKLKDAGYQDAYCVRLKTIPSTVAVMMSDILADSTDRAARIYLKKCYHQIGARLVRAAAKGPDGKRPLSSLYARRVVALGLASLYLSTRTRSRQLHSRLIKGIPQTCFLGLLKDPYTKARPKLSALMGRHKPSPAAIGYLDALKAVGLLQSEQLPKSQVTAGERLGEYSLNRYHVITAYPSGPLTDAELDEILRSYPYTENAGFQQLTRSHPAFFPDSLEPQALGPP